MYPILMNLHYFFKKIYLLILQNYNINKIVIIVMTNSCTIAIDCKKKLCIYNIL